VMGAFEDAAARELTISHSALAKLFKAYPGLEDDLKGVVQSKTTFRFSAKQPVNPDAPQIGDGDEE
jgi:hypothetical protein